MAVVAAEGNRQVLTAVNEEAEAAGLAPGMTLTHAQALVRNLVLAPAEPLVEQRDLARLAAACLRYSPWTRACPPDGIWIDATGVAHLFGGEAAMLDRIVARLGKAGLAARAAIADTPGAAWAFSHHGKTVSVIPPGLPAPMLKDLPVAALRLPPATVEALRRLGFGRVGELYEVPRGTMARRFGPEVLERLDQALGHLFEPLDPVAPPPPIQRRLAFAEPISQPEDFRRATEDLTVLLCHDLEAAGAGARLLILAVLGVDGGTQRIMAGTAQASRDPLHLSRLLVEKLDRIDPGFGVEIVTLTAWRSESLLPRQSDLHAGREKEPSGLAPLIDRLANRLGEGRVYGLAPVQSDVPERSVRRRPPLAPADGADWPRDVPRPVRLLFPAEPIEAMALLPDHPPMFFVWRRERHVVKRADGPERVFGEWWRRPEEVRATRDYFHVEDEAGARFWLYREGLSAGSYRWYLHGLFG